MRPRPHVLDADVALQEIQVAETLGADWCCWTPIAPSPGCRLEVTVGLALGICNCMADVTVSGLNW